MTDKPVKCSKCSRSFKNKRGLKQHLAASHSGTPAKRPQGQKAASVSQPMRVRTKLHDSAVLSGVDRLQHVGDVSIIKPGVVFLDLLIVPGDFERLKHVAKSFQKIRYNMLRFRIEPQISTTTSGGYVAAFIRDPADVPPKNKILNYLTSQQGSVTTKWWQATVIQVPIAKKEYYTSQGVEVRDYSPGKIMIAADGQATQAGSLTVFVEWNVTLTQAGLENDIEVVKEYAALRDMYTRNGYKGLWTKNKTNWDSAAPATEISNAKIGDQYALPFPIPYQETAAITRNTWYLKVSSDNVICPAFENAEDAYEGNAISETLFIKRGTVLSAVTTEADKVTLKDDFLDTPGLSSNPTPQTPSLEQPIGRQLLDFLRRFEMLLKEPPPATSSLLERDKSMACSSSSHLTESITSLDLCEDIEPE